MSTANGSFALRPNRRSGGPFWVPYIAVLATGLPLVAIAMKRPPQFTTSVVILVVTLCVCVARPFAGLVAIVFFSLIGDIVTSLWWPFTKNLSSRESIMFVSVSLGISPLEMCLFGALTGVAVAYLRSGAWPLRRNALTTPVLLFVACTFVGFARGILSGGDHRVALFELRPFGYLLAVFTLMCATCRRPAQVRMLLWAASAAIVVHALISMRYISHLTPAAKKQTESIMEHSAALRMNVLALCVIGAWIYKGVSLRVRLALTACLVPVTLVYMAAQRRAAFLSLATALIVVAVALLWRHRRTFYRIVPVASVGMAGYVGAFWNSTGSAAFPAQAIKSAIAPEKLDSRNQSSDLYRIIENFDLHFTIRSSKVFGLGFGHPFYRPISLPNLNNFEYYLHIPHNSVLWMWIAAGFPGFVAMFYLFVRALMVGASRLRSVTEPIDAVVMTACVGFLVMLPVFAYVDIAWDARDLIMFGVALGACVMYPTRSPAPPPDQPSTRSVDDDRRTPEVSTAVMVRAAS